MRLSAYSSKWIRGASRIRIEINDWRIVEDNGGAKLNKLSVIIYNEKKKRVDGKTIDLTSERKVKFINLKTKNKYYVEFVISDTGNYYSLNGSISTK